MEKWEKALELLEERVKECDFQDEVCTMVGDIISNNICDIEKELGMSDDIDEDGVAWYDEIMDGMRFVLYNRIAKWLTRNSQESPLL